MGDKYGLTLLRKLHLDTLKMYQLEGLKSMFLIDSTTAFYHQRM